MARLLEAFCHELLEDHDNSIVALFTNQVALGMDNLADFCVQSVGACSVDEGETRSKLDNVSPWFRQPSEHDEL